MNFQFFKYLKTVVLPFFKKINKDEIPVYAQALTFNTLLTIIPILGLIISLARIFVPQQTLVNQIILEVAKYLTPEATQKVIKVIFQILKGLEKFPLGKFSIVTYFLMGSGLLFQIEDVLNKIFESSKRRTFVQRLTFFWLFITLTPLIFLMPLSFHSYISNFSSLIFFLIFLFFFLMYIYFPAKDVPKKEALIGAIFSTGLWIFSSYIYSIYIKYAVNYSKIYGSLAAIPLFLIWIFINWSIFLLGAELIVFLEQKAWKKIHFELPHLWLKLYIMYIIGKNFSEGKNLNIYELSKILDISPMLVESSLQELESQGFIVIKEDNIFLAKPLDKIKITDIIELKTLLQARSSELNEFLKKVKKLLTHTFEITLQDLVT
ncbi:YihY/virulence factor BrkB family protein [Thermodesulfobacterium hydrogeniphilum]|uniref:YihY/virulence factor BrkB family protein n=1 Tax=Thermodesulfobacterium hydrogeniphilum TaxID=161156 RepID=UPI00056E9761|nr:YihY/virulence factor BrkB family protein [Thermodesulfobacterium hydrogeniphilum]